MLRNIGKQSGESVESVESGRRKGRLRWEGFAEIESFKPGVEEWVMKVVKSMELMEEVPLKELGDAELD